MGHRDEYQRKMEAELREWQGRLDILKAKADKAGAEARLEYLERIEALRAKQQEVQQKLGQLQAAGEDAWDDIKAGLETAWSDFRQALDSASRRFK
jgi:hypothetical protein